MTKEEKQILLKDLCARLSYGVKVQANGEICTLIEIDYEESSCGVKHIDRHLSGEDIEKVNPYLRPMSSMTEEEYLEYNETREWKYVDDDHYECFDTLETFDWLNEHHFDYRGLIEKGLAIAVTKENNPYEN